jgi:hypothetical protein
MNGYFEKQVRLSEAMGLSFSRFLGSFSSLQIPNGFSLTLTFGL